MSLLIIGELGEAFKLENISDLKKYIDIYSKRMNIDSNEICLFDKNGKSINLYDVNSQESKYFIFNKVFYKEQLIKIFDENVSKYVTNFNNSQQINLEVTPMKIMMNEMPMLEKYNINENDLKVCDDMLINYFDSCKGSCKAIKQNTKICEKMKENYSFQFNSLECLYKNISNLYEQVLTKYKEVESNLLKMIDRNDKSLSQFKESIDKLKKTEIHPKMQVNGIKYLIDIYFDEVKMNEWKEKCLKSQGRYWYIISDALSKKIKSQASVIHDEKTKIRNEKNQNMIALKNEWNAMITEFDNLYENDSINISILSNIHDDVKAFHKIVNSLVMADNSNVEEYLQKINYYKNKNYKEYLGNMDKSTASLEILIKKMKNLLIKSSVTINIIFTNYHNVKRSLLEVDEKLGKYALLLDSLEKDFSYLLNPKMFPIAYTASIIEIKRRLLFNTRITKEFEKLKQLIVKENFQRKQFIEEHGRYLTNDYVPLLKFTDLKLGIEYENNEEVNNLPQILEEDDLDNPSLNTQNNLLVSQSIDNGGAIKSSQNIGPNLLVSNRRNENEPRVDSSTNLTQPYEFKQLLALNQKLKDEVTNIRENNYKKLEELNKAHDIQQRELHDKYQSTSIKLSEYEIIHNIKEKEIKKLIEKIEQRDRKITNCQGEIERLGKSIESLNENFISQVKMKDEKLREKIVETENLLKSNVRNIECIMCKDSVSNSLEYQTWNPYIKDLNEKLIEKNRKHTKLESRFDELIRQTQFIKRTYFNHLNSVIAAKNTEVMGIKQMYESRLMTAEDSVSTDKIKYEQLLKENQKTCHEEMKKQLDDEIKVYKQNYKVLEKKYNDMQKEYNELNNIVRIREKQKNQFENEAKNLRQDYETLKIKNENLIISHDVLKNKENNLGLELKSKETIIESLKKEIKTYEKESDSNMKKIKKLNEDIDNKAAEISQLNSELDKKHKQLIEIETSLSNTKAQHIEFMTNVYKVNQFEIEKIRQENDKLKAEFEMYRNNQDRSIDQKNHQIEEMSSKSDLLEYAKEELQHLKKKIEELNSTIASLNLEKEIMKKKNEEMQSIVSEKEKKITEYNELTKLYLTDNNFLSSTKNISNNFMPEIQMNTLAITSNILKYENDEFVSVKKLEKGTKAIFVPHSAGIYVCINLNSVANYTNENNSQGNYDSNCENKFFKCNAILSLEYFDSELKELLMEHSLIIIGRIGKITDHFANTDNNPYGLPEDNNYLLCDLDKIDYILGFQGEEMIFRNYIF